MKSLNVYHHSVKFELVDCFSEHLGLKRIVEIVNSSKFQSTHVVGIPPDAVVLTVLL